jgi:beta-phosphoglucomutase
MIKGTIFDMDGVLVDSHPAHMRAWTRFLLNHGRPVSEADMQFILEGRKREEILRHFLGDLTPEQMQSYGREKEILFREESRTIDTIRGVREFLEELAKASVPIAVATCGGRGRVQHLLETLQLTKYFSVVVTGDDVKEGKPDPSIFLKAANELKLRVEDVLALEDSVSGVQSAKAARMKCLGIAAASRADELKQAGADYVVEDFRHVTLAKVYELFP